MIPDGPATLHPKHTQESPAPNGQSSAVWPALQQLPSVTGAIHDSLLPPAGRCLTSVTDFLGGSNRSYAPNHSEEVAAVISWAGAIADLGAWVGQVGDAFAAADAGDGQQQTTPYVPDSLLGQQISPVPDPAGGVKDRGYEVDWQHLGVDPSVSDFFASQITTGGAATNGLALEAETAKAESHLLGESSNPSSVKIVRELKQSGLKLTVASAAAGAAASAAAYASDALGQGASTSTVIDGAATAAFSNAASSLGGGTVGEAVGTLAAGLLPPGADAVGELVLPAVGSLVGASVGGYLSDKLTGGVPVTPASVAHLVSSPSTAAVQAVDGRVRDTATGQAVADVGDSPRLDASIAGPSPALVPIPGLPTGPPFSSPLAAPAGLGSSLPSHGAPTVPQLDGLQPAG